MTDQAYATAGIDTEQARRAMGALVEQVASVVRGRDATIRLIAAAFVAGGHVLLEDLPGSGKTTLGRAFAHAADVSFGRIQATADMLPADITGSAVWEPDSRRFRFVPGPLFANLVLADELNRASSRTQSAFMEALEEHAVTVDGVRHALPDPFFVIATQNPVEQYGTFPLPEGQLDRFMLCLHLGALDPLEELRVLSEQVAGATVDRLTPAVDAATLRQLRETSRRVHTSEAVRRYLLTLVIGTRQHPQVAQGASTRAAIALNRAAQAWALLNGRDYVRPEDVQMLAGPVLAHRLVLVGGPASDATSVIAELIQSTPVLEQ